MNASTQVLAKPGRMLFVWWLFFMESKIGKIFPNSIGLVERWESRVVVSAL